ncbi:hypothetical protein F4813DRAFT_389184 [Daldinia decipiens]|uniref:uncharacterized protein n=1 Tax=Daldinia decipiens TaxID=326647 RepID=UPI0020C4A14D|nr:uncharacterized protein F4813DRAFT_389184 [Daldinia decipiens]KAI1657918.1 hypothetical protein F4813DRAFT_389184 [Daldinia decipiens]
MTEGKQKCKANEADAAEDCSWRGDSPEPELDDLAHKEEPHRPRPPDEVCSWQGDPPEPELDDLAHSPKLSPRSQVHTRVEQLLEEIDPMPLDAFPKPENHKKASKAHFEDEQPGEQEQDVTEETLHERITHGVQHVLTVFHSIVNPSSSQAHEEASENNAEPAGEENNAPPGPSRIPPILTTVEPQNSEGKNPKEEKQKAKRDKAEAKKVEKERKAREKEEKKRLKVEKRKERNEHKERRHKEKGKKKSKGKEKETASPPDLPPGADGPAAIESHHHPGCQICEHPEEQGTHDFMKDLLESWEGLPSLNDLTEAAKKLLGLKATDDTPDAQQSCQNLSLNEQELIEHIAAHIDRHIHQYIDRNPSGEGDASAGKSSSNKPSCQNPGQGPDTPGQQQQAGCEDGRPTSHGLDGNRDWPMTIMQGHIFRSIEPMSVPDIATSQSPPRDCSPFRTPTSRCVSPWCEKLGLKLDDPPLFQKPTVPWSRRGFNSSPSRMRTAATPSCLNAPLCSHPVYHEHGLYACVPVSLVPALSLESPCCGHSNCHYASPMMTPMPVSHTPRPLFNFEPFGTAETIPPSTPRRSLSANETQIVF